MVSSREWKLLFWIAIATLAFVYYKGSVPLLTGLLTSGSNAFTRIWYAITSRTSTGQFANYPK